MALGNKDIMGENIKYYMEKRNIDRNKLCQDLKIPYMTISDWINAKSYPRIDKIEMLANYFNIKKSDLVEKRNTTIASTLTSIYEQLEPTRQVKVVDYAKEQLKEQEEYCFVNAAHERTDIVGTKEMKDHDNDIMDDENF